MPCSTSRTLAIAIVLIALVTEAAIAQEGSGSPYSSYGLGDLSGTTQTGQALMGGTGVAVIDPYGLVGGNAAGYPFLYRPVFAFGGVARWIRASDAITAQDVSRTRFLGFDLGVPFGKARYGLAIGIRPVSETGYQVNEYATLSTGETVRYHYTGSGGINRAYAGLGAVVWQRTDSLKNGPKLSLGLDLAYLFGTIEQNRKTYYPQGVGYYNANVFAALNLGSRFDPPALRFGIQYHDDLVPRRMKDDDPWRFIIGATYEPQAKMNARSTDYATQFIVINNVELLRDTINPLSIADGNMTLPAAYGFGLAVKNARWNLTAELRMRDWSGLTVEVDGYELPGKLATGTTVAAGASLHPIAARDGGGFFERAWYRTGFRYTNDYLIVKDRQLNEVAFSLGASLPVLGAYSRTRLDLGCELGQRGTESDGLILERFVNVFVGISYSPEFRESWFRKRRIE